MKRRCGVACCALIMLFLLGACAQISIPGPPPVPIKDYNRPLPPGATALRKITDPAHLPDFQNAFEEDRKGLLRALDESVAYLSFASSQKHFPIQGITHERAVASLIYFRDMLRTAGSAVVAPATMAKSASADELHEQLLATFDIYQSVGCDNAGTVLFTGYYTPIFDASLTPTSEFRWPLHSVPPEEGRAEAYTRGEIMNGALQGENELAYLKDAFEAYVCTIQGSAQLRLRENGSMFKIGYAGTNGREYTSVGRLLIEDGFLTPGQLTLSGLIDFFRAHPDKVAEYLPRNERYVFFKHTDTEPNGSLGRPVTPYRSLATDKSIFPRASLVFVDTVIPTTAGAQRGDARPFRQFMLDQDTGGAIRAAGRADIYLGIGEQAGRIAGWTLNEGRLYYLFLKE